MNTKNIKRLAGWATVFVGTGHLLGSVPLRLDAWSALAGRGLLSAEVITPQSAADREAAEAFWFSLGSFAAPSILLGGFVVWAAGRDVRVPAPLGWGLVAWGAVSVAFMPLSLALLFPVAGLLIVAADRAADRTAATA